MSWPPFRIERRWVDEDAFTGKVLESDPSWSVQWDDARVIVDPKRDKGVDPKAAVGVTKVPLWNIPGSATVHMSAALADGARKYGPFNWRSTEVKASIYISAIRRHLDAWVDGEDRSSDANVHHFGHAMAGLAILLDAMECGTLVDDRPAKGKAGDVQKRFAEGTL